MGRGRPHAAVFLEYACVHAWCSCMTDGGMKAMRDRAVRVEARAPEIPCWPAIRVVLVLLVMIAMHGVLCCILQHACRNAFVHMVCAVCCTEAVCAAAGVCGGRVGTLRLGCVGSARAPGSRACSKHAVHACVLMRCEPTDASCNSLYPSARMRVVLFDCCSSSLLTDGCCLSLMFVR